MQSTDKIKRAKKYGVLCFIALPISAVLPICLMVFLEEEFHVILITTIMQSLFTLLLTFLYVKFLTGIREIASLSRDDTFMKSAENFYWGCLLAGVIISLPVASEVTYNLHADILTVFLSVFFVLAIIILGILSVQLADGLHSVQNKYGEMARRASKWNKIGGYLMCTLILSPIGWLASLVADFYMWRLLGEHLKLEKNESSS